MFGLNTGLLGITAAVHAVHAAFAPTSLFQQNEQGAWYDPSDLSTMFQDSAGTTPVTADGQPVGLILDKSGNGNHASQATAAKRPLLQNDGVNNYLAFDGVDDVLVTASIDFTSTDKMSVFSGVRKVGSDQNSHIVYFGTGGYGALRGFSVNMPLALNSKFSTTIGDATQSVAGYESNGSYTLDTSFVTFTGFDLALGVSTEDRVYFRKNAAETGPTNAMPALTGGTTFANSTLSVASSGDGRFFFNGRIYSLIILGRLATTQEITDTETWVNSKTGAY